MPTAVIESLDQDGRGVTHVDEKAIFVEGALPLERVEYSSFRRKPHYELATLSGVRHASTWRTPPRCRYFGVCGGCSMQHLDAAAQAATKQRVLEDALWHIARLRAETVLPAIYGPTWGYRHRARLTVRLVMKKGGILVGFHERRSSYVADMTSCETLPPAVSKMLPSLRALIGGLSIPDRLPQIEVAVGDAVVALVLRHLQPFNGDDQARLRQFAEDTGVQLWLQPTGPDSAHLFRAAEFKPLSYRLPEFDIEIRFRPTDFTQVNHAMNRVLVRRALALLQLRQGERVADMFCGLGNFALPMARRGAEVVGVEGSPGLVDRARENARINGLAEGARFETANLFQVDPTALARLGTLDKMLIDPPREGAVELVKALGIGAGPLRIVYVSCNPATLARDAAILVREKGYRLLGAGIANMFPHTSHVESIAEFERS
jgi:23S rRNA (uracil1939-C5)-methyltransferase